MNWKTHIVKAGPYCPSLEGPIDPKSHREHVEPWLAALFQAEHLNLLVGSGLTTAVAQLADAPLVDMNPPALECRYADLVERSAREGAKRIGRAKPNVEDYLRTAMELVGGLRILAAHGGDDTETNSRGETAATLLQDWQSALDSTLASLLAEVLATERGIEDALASDGTPKAESVLCCLGGFLLPFGSRASTRERAHIFTVNYDRLIEYGCDLLGLRTLDRFVGSIAPTFQSSRLGIDLHYNPPGIRGEPRYLEGVVRLTKLHGSVDWRSTGPPGSPSVQRCSLPFGLVDDDPSLSQRLSRSLLIYPNPAKDLETLEFPYADLFRDFAAAVCRPNAVVVTYGYGFGDDHVNRALMDMLRIPSTHLVVISYGDADGRVPAFYKRAGRPEQISLLLGRHFGNLKILVDYYLPKPAIDSTTIRMADLLNRRELPSRDNDKSSGASAPPDGRST